MSTPRFPDQQEDRPPATPLTWRTKAIIAAVVVALALIVVLHIAHVFGP